MSVVLPLRGRTAALRAEPRSPGEASFFWYDAHFKSDAVKVLPGEHFVSADPGLLIMTTLGSCISVCLWDRHSAVGGLNHFMLADGDDASGRYGAYAMELLINRMMKLGAGRASLEAKVFGGGQVVSGMHTITVGEKNTRFALDYLKTERIPVVSKDVLDVYPRKVCFVPSSGKALVKRLEPTSSKAVVERERQAAPAASAASGGSVELF